ncbi:hypothetical protein AWN90_02600 [Nocardia terpenica]|uniref:Uncharacterized protein n=1 Tax=Nocardia terpenica TaxID=455432 RepID=A0A164KQJ6_9NOCA|nr:hypothetical protein AWN90_02600 [Nocardia terpenica]
MPPYDERMMREIYAHQYQLRVVAQQLTELSHDWAAMWREGEYSEQWAHLADAVSDWSSTPNRLRAWTDRYPVSGIPNVDGDFEWRNMIQAQLLADPLLAGDRWIAAADQARAVETVDDQVREAADPDSVSVNALIHTAHRQFSTPFRHELLKMRTPSEVAAAETPVASQDSTSDRHSRTRPDGGERMDPDAALGRIRQLVREVQQGNDNDESIDYLDELIDHWDALDDWLSRGGFPPASWDRDRDQTPPEKASAAELISAATPTYDIAPAVQAPSRQPPGQIAHGIGDELDP